MSVATVDDLATPEDASDGPGVPDDVTGLSIAELISGLTSWSGQLAAGEAVFLDLVGEFDAREGWAGVGILSCAHWLSWRCSLGPNAARERVRVARALRSLPQTRAAFRAARLSYSQVRALTRVATPETEASLITCARESTAGQLERLVRGMRRALAASETAAAHEVYVRRRFDYYYDDQGALVVRGRFPAEEGAVLVAAIEAAMDQLVRNDDERNYPSMSDLTDVSGGTGLLADHEETSQSDVSAETCSQAVSAEARNAPQEIRGPSLRADALVAVASSSLMSARRLSSRDDYRVLVHVDADALFDDGAGDQCAIDGGPTMPPETVRRLLCDGAFRAVTTLADGSLLDLGRTARFPSAPLKRALKHRDKTCQFPGCTRRRNLDIHHIEFWVRDNGPTDRVNLVRLCPYHHHQVHEGGFTLTRSETGRIVVRHPAGWIIPAAPTLPPSTPGQLTDANEAQGTAISSDTLPPDWNGDRLDLHYAVSVLMQDDANVETNTAEPAA